MRYQIKNGFILVSPEDIELLDQYVWTLDENGYARTFIYSKELKRTVPIRMHNMLLPTEKPYIVDHIDRNPRNNQRSNLRIVTYQENWYNSDRADRLFSLGKLKHRDLYLLVNAQ